MWENSWAPFFLKPEKVTNNTTALVASEAGITAHWYCQSETRNKLMNTSFQKKEDWHWPMTCYVDGHPSICMNIYGAEMETLGLHIGRACKIHKAEHITLTLI